LPDQDDSARAQAAAAKLGLTYKHIFTNLDVLEARLVALVEERRQLLAKRTSTES
jgi:molybdenum-dependent DNA-binding transcriptional regulator ModE